MRMLWNSFKGDSAVEVDINPILLLAPYMCEILMYHTSNTNLALLENAEKQAKVENGNLGPKLRPVWGGTCPTFK